MQTQERKLLVLSVSWAASLLLFMDIVDLVTNHLFLMPSFCKDKLMG